MSLSSGSSDASGIGRRHSPFDIGVLAANIVLLGFFVNTLYLYVARACPDPNEGGLFDTWQRGLVVRGGWPTWEVIVPYFFYHYLGVTSVEGLQSIGAFCSLVGAVVVNYLVYFKFGIDGYRRAIVLLIFNAAILSGDEKFLFFARWGILAYPLRIFAGSLFIYLLIAYSRVDRRPGHFQTIALGLLASCLVYAHYILVLPICAVFAALCITQLVRREFQWTQWRQWVLPLAFLFVVPVVTGIVVNLSDPQLQLKAPREAIRGLYFMYNDSFEKSFRGYVSFVGQMSGEVAYQIAFPYAWISRSWHYGKLVSSVPLILICLGLVVSIFRRKEFRFVLAVFLLVDLTLRLGANFGGWFPFGNVRYILSQVFALQLMAGFGLADIVTAVYWVFFRIVPGSEKNRIRMLLAQGVAFVLTIAVLFSAYAESIEQRSVSLRYQQDSRTIKSEFGTLQGATIIMTEDQERLIIGKLLGEEFFKKNRVLLLPHRGSDDAWTPERIEATTEGIGDRDTLVMITFRPFREDPYGPTGYRLIASRFTPVDEREMWDLYFTTWRSINPKLSVSP